MLAKQDKAGYYGRIMIQVIIQVRYERIPLQSNRGLALEISIISAIARSGKGEI